MMLRPENKSQAEAASFYMAYLLKDSGKKA